MDDDLDDDDDDDDTFQSSSALFIRKSEYSKRLDQVFFPRLADSHVDIYICLAYCICTAVAHEETRT